MVESLCKMPVLPSKVVEKAKENYEKLKQEAELQLKEEDMMAENKRDLKKKLVAFRRVRKPFVWNICMFTAICSF
jgi:hypothetical protein